MESPDSRRVAPSVRRRLLAVPGVACAIVMGGTLALHSAPVPVPVAVVGLGVLLVAACAGAYRAGRGGLRAALTTQDEERLHSQLIERSPDAVVLVELDTLRVRQANAAAARLLAEDPVDRPLAELVGLPEAHLAGLLRGLAVGARVPVGEVERPGPDGRPLSLELSATRLALGAREVIGVLARDITERRRAEEKTRQGILRDPLTGLPNRFLFQDRLATALAQAQRTHAPLAVAFLDLDGFKEVNDGFGHDAADRLLVEVAARLVGCLRAGDTVARQGGDEFLLLFTRLGAPEEVAALSTRVLDALRPPFVLDGREVHVSGSLGVAVAPNDGTDPATLVRHADLAMYQAKESGRGVWRTFTPALRARAARVIDLRGRIARGLARGEFRLVYQPQVDLASGRVVAVEALIRWHSPEGVISPMDFIPVAEQTGQIIDIGAWVMHRACADGQAWADQGLPPIRVAVNLSARQFFQDGVVALTREALAASRLAPERLELEITESLAMRDPEMARRALAQLKAEGVSVALDDFGTGHSSLSYLRLYPVDRIKIDRSFLTGVRCDGDEPALLLAAMIHLGQALRREVVAEGVETAAQIALLRRERCDLGQGFGLFRPMAAAQVALVLGAKDGGKVAAAG